MKTSIYILPLLLALNLSASDMVPQKVRKSESNPDYHHQRQDWLESMHRTEPGVDWKIIERQVKEYKQQERNENRQQLGIKDNDFLLSTSIAQGSIRGQWHERGSNNQSGRIHCADIDFERELIYLGSSGGNVWRGTLHGDNWTCLNNSFQFNIRDVRLIKTTTGPRILVFDNFSVFYSDDEGYTWNKASGADRVSSTGNIIRGISVLNNNSNIVYFLANENFQGQNVTLYYSLDNGENFKRLRVHQRHDPIDIWGSDVGSPNLYLFHRDSVFEINVTNTAEQLQFIAVFPDYSAINNPRYYAKGSIIDGNANLYLAIRSGSENRRHIIRSLDAGSNWEYKGYVETDMFMWNSFCVSKKSPNFLILGGIDCFYSTNGGTNWFKYNNWWEYYPDPENKLHADIPGVNSYISPTGEEIFLISTDGGIYRTYDNYLKIKNISLKKLNVSQYYSIYTYNTPLHIIFAGSQDQGFQRSEPFDGDILDFEQTISGDYGSLSSGDHGKSIWTVYPGFVLYYPDAVKSQNNVRWTFTGRYADRVWMPPVAAVPNSPRKAYLAPGGSNNNSTIFKLEYINNLLKVNELSYVFDADNQQNDVSALAVSPVNTYKLYAATKLGKFYTSSDEGQTWRKTQGFTGPGYNYLHPTKILPSISNQNVVYLAGSGYSSPAVYMSDDDGISFKPISNGLPPCMVYDLAFTEDEEFLFAATSTGPYVYIKTHNKWYSMDGLENPDQNYWSVNYLYDKKIVRFATYGRGIWDFNISHLSNEPISSVDNIVAAKHLNVFPNPSNGIINLNFTTTTGKRTVVKLYDLEGRILRILFDGYIDDDSLSIKRNLNENEHNTIAPGNYLIVATSGNITNYFKLNILR